MTLPQRKFCRKSAQLLSEQIKNLESNAQKIIAMYLSGYSNKSITLATLQNDAEFKTLLNEARLAAKQMDHHEQHELCEEIVNYKE